MNNSELYTISNTTPSVDTYCQLRTETGLKPKTREAAEIGLKGTIFAVQILFNNTPIGMGRIIGDGGCFFQVVDIGVLPAHQGKGLGKLIVNELMKYIKTHAPKSAYISLIADGKAKDLYAQFGFKPTAPNSIGMAINY